VTDGEFITELALATKEQMAAVVAPLLERIAALETTLAAAPAVDVIAAKAALLVPKPADGRDAAQVDVEAIAAKAALLIPKPEDRKDAPPVDVEAIAVKAAALVPRPADGKDAPHVDLEALAVKAAALVPPPAPGKDGKDAPPVDVEALALKAAALIPRPEPGRDGKDVDMAAVTLAIEGAVTKAVAALPVPRNGQDGKDGADGQGVDMGLVLKAISDEVAKIPAPRDGRDVDAAMLETIVSAHVDRAVAALPRPKDGASVTLDDVEPLVTKAVAAAVAEIPKAADGVGVSDAVLGREGDLILTFSDGRTKSLGVVVGANADPVEVKRLIAEMVDAIPRPQDGAPGKDGVDGLGFDDMDVVIDDETCALRFSRDGRVKEFVIPAPIDRGVYRPGQLYRKGAIVTAQGALWSAQADTRERPGDGSTSWRLAVKKGKDGKDLTERKE
jgi:hypothetical protein